AMKEVLTRDIKKVPTLRGKTVVNLFFEPSTRTRTSFEIAGKRLSADVINFSAATSSLTKGETLKDTARNIEAMVVDAVVVRHSASGAVRYLARELDVPVINAGDGAHEHPTQGLLDIFTIRERKGSVEGLKVAVAGDIAHSRVARSGIHGLLKLGAQVVVAGPPTMVPPDIERLGVSVASSVEEVLGEVDVVIMLRIQMERQSSPLFPSLREYSRYFGLNMEKLKSVSRDLLIMHPGPVNWGVELSPEVAYHPRNVILDQVTNGVAVRMAVLYAIIGG
ncbi:MAG: aspartate carbamoyltransferase, partial [Aquificota bacterium]